MQIKKMVVTCLVFILSHISIAQVTLETGVPSLLLSKSKFESTGFRLDSYLKLGYEKGKVGFGLTGITKSSLGLVGNEFFVGPYVNYQWKPTENSKFIIAPEISVLYSQRKQSAEMGLDQYKLLTANVGVGLEYKLNKN